MEIEEIHKLLIRSGLVVLLAMLVITGIKVLDTKVHLGYLEIDNGRVVFVRNL